MNIFPTHSSPVLSAFALDDKRVVRQASEAVVILSHGFHVAGLAAPYPPHQLDHPLNQWIGATHEARAWTFAYAEACNREYERRYPGRQCASLAALASMRQGVQGLIPIPRTFSNCASNLALGLNFRGDPDVINAYRDYLNARWALDKRPPVWTGCNPPLWKK